MATTRATAPREKTTSSVSVSNPQAGTTHGRRTPRSPVPGSPERHTPAAPVKHAATYLKTTASSRADPSKTLKQSPHTATTTAKRPAPVVRKPTSKPPSPSGQVQRAPLSVIPREKSPKAPPSTLLKKTTASKATNSNRSGRTTTLLTRGKSPSNGSASAAVKSKEVVSNVTICNETSSPAGTVEELVPVGAELEELKPEEEELKLEEELKPDEVPLAEDDHVSDEHLSSSEPGVVEHEQHDEPEIETETETETETEPEIAINDGEAKEGIEHDEALEKPVGEDRDSAGDSDQVEAAAMQEDQASQPMQVEESQQSQLSQAAEARSKLGQQTATFARRSEAAQGKKEAAPAGNTVIEKAAGRLAEKKRNKVLALVGAFETVISLQEPEGQPSEQNAKEEETTTTKE